MADVLSQSEIDALLNGINSGELDAEEMQQINFLLRGSLLRILPAERLSPEQN